jgi:hypothetical protein
MFSNPELVPQLTMTVVKTTLDVDVYLQLEIITAQP